jgi:hypothetical protein
MQVRIRRFGEDRRLATTRKAVGFWFEILVAENRV